MSRFFGSGLVRGLALVAVVSAVIVALSAEWSVALAGAILWIAFLVVLAIVLTRLVRERRGAADHWSRRGRLAFGAALAVAGLDIVLAIVLTPSRGDAVLVFVVLAAAVYAAVRVWRDEQRLA